MTAPLLPSDRMRELHVGAHFSRSEQSTSTIGEQGQGRSSRCRDGLLLDPLETLVSAGARLQRKRFGALAATIIPNLSILADCAPSLECGRPLCRSGLKRALQKPKDRRRDGPPAAGRGRFGLWNNHDGKLLEYSVLPTKDGRTRIRIQPPGESRNVASLPLGTSFDRIINHLRHGPDVGTILCNIS